MFKMALPLLTLPQVSLNRPTLRRQQKEKDRLRFPLPSRSQWQRRQLEEEAGEPKTRPTKKEGRQAGRQTAPRQQPGNNTLAHFRKNNYLHSVISE